MFLYQSQYVSRDYLDGKHFLLIVMHCNFCYFNFNLLLSKEALGEAWSSQVCTPSMGMHAGCEPLLSVPVPFP